MSFNNPIETRTPTKIIPERIREAKEARGFTAETFADALGVTRQAVGQYEIGQSAPSAEIMSKIIALTEQPPSFFTTERARNTSSFRRPFWRSLKRMERRHRMRISRRLEWTHDIVQYIEKFIDLPDVNLPDIKFNWESEANQAEEEIESIAEKLRDY
ncbi:MAG: helix-turn-helix transcriptional regulator, partial [Sphingomonadales bacterium]|nr:helix-turn-helix transcriptional regulator [Sphingomonadales bacterium]